VIGLSPKLFKFAKAYANLRADALEAIERYAQDVRTGAFPDDEHSFH
jgi:3-methyl-2-oxobutanoate hydroxymethyltransferase